MKKITQYALMAALALSLFSCSSSSKEPNKDSKAQEEALAGEVKEGAQLIDDNTLVLGIPDGTVYGETGEYLEIVPGNYKMTLKDGNIRLKLKLKLKEALPADKVIDNYPSITLKDADEADVLKYGSEIYLDNKDKFESFMKMEEGTVEDFLFVPVLMNADQMKTVMKSTQYVKLGNLSIKSQAEIDAQDKELDDAIDNLNKTAESAQKALELGKSALDMVDALTE